MGLGVIGGGGGGGGGGWGGCLGKISDGHLTSIS